MANRQRWRGRDRQETADSFWVLTSRQLHMVTSADGEPRDRNGKTDKDEKDRRTDTVWPIEVKFYCPRTLKATQDCFSIAQAEFQVIKKKCTGETS